ncbi:polysaccharide export protein, BexD/CtrA/VexA family [unidentified eubacterium SCB49]|nr:polysaccharide export protein, BexD/CtrA/VexA family [unidentified eubacterium SCB49]
MNKYLFVLISLWLFTSCATRKQIVYFQDSEDLNQTIRSLNFEPIIESNDVLHISVSALDEAAVVPFQRDTGNQQSGQNILLQGYLVNAEGQIQFPTLGAIDVKGKTRREVEIYLKDQLSEFIKDVVIDVRIMNFKVTVLGEVMVPGVHRIVDERVTLLEAIALAGDLTEDARRDDVTIIREESGVQTVAKVDILTTDFINSPYYFLKQNDVVYIEPSLKGVKKSGLIPDVPAMLSFVTIVLSTVILLTR